MHQTNHRHTSNGRSHPTRPQRPARNTDTGPARADHSNHAADDESTTTQRQIHRSYF